jgi:cytochrome c peroxidase
MNFAKSIWILWVIFLVGCTKESDKLHPITLIRPNGFPTMEQSVSDLNLTVEGVALGRRLFYDKQLSADESTSCGSLQLPHPSKCTSTLQPALVQNLSLGWRL